MPPPSLQQPPVGSQSAAVGNDPVILDRTAARRTEDVVRFVETSYRLRSPRNRFRPTSANAGIWAYVAGTITGASGARLGSGTAVLCSRAGDTLTADGPTVGVLNGGGGVVGPVYVKLGWTDGDWSLDVAPCPPEA